MQEVVTTVYKYCDGHLMLDDKKVTENISTKQYDLGTGLRVIEICEWCEENLSIKDLRDILKELGRIPEEERPARGSTVNVRTGAGNKYKRRVGDLQCKFCEAVPFTSVHGCTTHEFRSHPFQRLMWERDNDYAAQAKLGRDQRERRDRRLKIAESMGLTLEEAVAKEKAAWNAGWRPGWDASAEAAAGPLSFRKEGAA